MQDGWMLPWGRRTLIMGILNVTPDSFSDGGRYQCPRAAAARARAMAEEGADIIDIGGESTRPGSEGVSAEEELHRVLPAVEAIAPESAIPISIDTTKASVARVCLAAGASIVNDTSALRDDPDMAGVVAEAGVRVVLMHRKGRPQKMQSNPVYEDCIAEIHHFFEKRIETAQKAGIASERILLDPGLGFGKRVQDNLRILRELAAFSDLGKPLLVGPSRKSMIGILLDLPVEERLEGTAAAVALAIAGGADVVRVHDVRSMVRVARMADAIADKPAMREAVYGQTSGENA